MRTLLTGAMLVLGAATLGAQQSDSIARRDSLLERERRRIAGEATSREAEATAPAKVKTPGLGWRSRVRIGAGVAGPSTWLEDASGLSVVSDVAPTVTAEYRFPRSRATEFSVGVRASRAGVTMDATPSYDGGSVWLLDLFAGSARAYGDRFSLRSGLVAVMVAGGEVAPFDEASRFAPGLDLGGALRLTRQVPLSVALAVELLRYGGSGDSPTGSQSGIVPRVMLELRHGY